MPSASEVAVLYEEARIRSAEGNVTGAFARYRRLLALAEAAGDIAWQAALLVEVGRMYQEVFDLLEARRWLAAALPLLEGLAAAEPLFRLGQIERLAGEPEAAEAHFDAALAAGAGAWEGQIRVARGLLLWELKRPEDGVPELSAGYALLKRTDPDEADRARLLIREARGRVGSLPYRALLTAAGADADLLG